MSKTLVVLCRGIADPMDTGMLHNLDRYLPPDEFEIMDLPWKAEYGPAPNLFGDPFEKNLSDGISLLKRLCLYDRADTGIVVVGYSGGAQLAGDVLRDLAACKARGAGAANVLGGALLSDPSQPKGIPGAGDKFGIRTSRTVGNAIPVRWYFDTKDVICCCTPPPDSLLRVFADASAEFSLAGPAAWSGSIPRLLVRKWQTYLVPWNNPLKLRDQINTAIYEAEGYLYRGDHTAYPVRYDPSDGLPYFESMANWIKELAKTK